MLVPVMMHKAEKYAIRMESLSEETKQFFLQNFGCARKVYNLYVEYLYGFLEKIGYIGGDILPALKLPEVTSFKEQYPYLKKADSLGLANAKIAFESAMKRYNEEHDHFTYTKRAKRRAESGKESLSFRGLKGIPRYHSRANGYFSYTTNCQYPTEGNSLKQPTIRLEGCMLHLPKLKDDIELCLHRSLPDNVIIGQVTISMDIDGAMYASIGYTYTCMMEDSLRNAALDKNRATMPDIKIIGLDYSQPHFYVDSDCNTADYPHYYRQAEEKLGKLQRELAHMEKGSSNYKKKQAEIQKLHIRIRNQRKDFVNKLAHNLASEYDVVAVEDIDLRAMGETLNLGKNLHDNGFGMFRNILARMLEEKGSVLVRVDRQFASTKTCHCCGAKNPDVILGVSEWTCPVCGVHHDRDVNAAINIREEGHRIFLEYFHQWLEDKAKAQKKAEALSNGRKRKKKTA